MLPRAPTEKEPHMFHMKHMGREERDGIYRKPFAGIREETRPARRTFGEKLLDPPAYSWKERTETAASNRYGRNSIPAASPSPACREPQGEEGLRQCAVSRMGGEAQPTHPFSRTSLLVRRTAEWSGTVRLRPPGRPGPDLPGCRRYARCRWRGGWYSG